MKALLAEVFTRFGARKGKPLEPGWATSNAKPNPALEVRPVKAVSVPPAKALDSSAEPFSALPPSIPLGTLASPEYISVLNARIEQFKQRVAALERFKDSGKDNGHRQAE